MIASAMENVTGATQFRGSQQAYRKLQVQSLTATLKKLLEKDFAGTNTPLKTVNKINTKNTFKAISHNSPFKIPTQGASK